jgi:hypothetical protein
MFFSEVGKTIKTGKITLIHARELQNGKFCYTFYCDELKSYFQWKTYLTEIIASNNLVLYLPCAIGKKFSIKGTISKQFVYKGREFTILYKCSIKPHCGGNFFCSLI